MCDVVKASGKEREMYEPVYIIVAGCKMCEIFKKKFLVAKRNFIRVIELNV